APLAPPPVPSPARPHTSLIPACHPTPSHPPLHPAAAVKIDEIPLPPADMQFASCSARFPSPPAQAGRAARPPRPSHHPRTNRNLLPLPHPRCSPLPLQTSPRSPLPAAPSLPTDQTSRSLHPRLLRRGSSASARPGSHSPLPPPSPR